ncbi:hypothetical protein AB1Y20_021364 [Prymnesium parvum]|uniref:tRNA/rRNA methyltransferase SpoU type domain-containing protein n=1 Tax=Prymnesium parvum TaxID=97485 RepID=A0AB34JM38_PRYPA
MLASLLLPSTLSSIAPASSPLLSSPRARALVSMSTDRLLYHQRVDEMARRKQGLLGTPEKRVLELRKAKPDDWRRVASALSPHAAERRVLRLQAALRQRRSRLHLVLENLIDPRNAAAVLRAAEACGLQHVHVVEAVTDFKLPGVAEASSSTAEFEAAAEALRWLTLHKYSSTRDCVDRLQQLGLQVFASDCRAEDAQESSYAPVVGEDAIVLGDALERSGRNTASPSKVQALPIDQLDFGACPAGSALVFGNERRGVSRQLLESASGSFYLPMSGLTQSFNVSVAVVMSLYTAIASGAFPEGDLTPDQQDELLGRWLLRDVKAARPLLMEVGIEFVDF